jgi:hypothetical protein
LLTVHEHDVAVPLQLCEPVFYLCREREDVSTQRG